MVLPPSCLLHIYSMPAIGLLEPSQPVLNTAGAVSTIGIICLLKAWPHASENHKKLV